MSRMSTFLTCLAGGLAICAVAYCVYRNNKRRPRVFKIPNLERKLVEAELSFEDIVGWFRTIAEIHEDQDVPFIAKANESLQFFDMGTLLLDTPLSPNKCAILLGIYNKEKGDITHSILLEADSWDAKTIEVLGDANCVVLS